MMLKTLKKYYHTSQLSSYVFSMSGLVDPDDLVPGQDYVLHAEGDEKGHWQVYYTSSDSDHHNTLPYLESSKEPMLFDEAISYLMNAEEVLLSEDYSNSALLRPFDPYSNEVPDDSDIFELKRVMQTHQYSQNHILSLIYELGKEKRESDIYFKNGHEPIIHLSRGPINLN